jgi:hypothetical protein
MREAKAGVAISAAENTNRALARKKDTLVYLVKKTARWI